MGHRNVAIERKNSQVLKNMIITKAKSKNTETITSMKVEYFRSYLHAVLEVNVVHLLSFKMLVSNTQVSQSLMPKFILCSVFEH